MSTTRSLALSGALIRAVTLIRRQWTDQRIFLRLQEVFPGYSNQDYLTVIALAHAGIAAANAINWNDPLTKIDVSILPKIPP